METSVLTRAFCFNYDPQFMTAEDNISDDVFEMDDNTNVLSNSLTPAIGERPLEKTPSPTGYRDYKPPAEVLSNNYSTTFRTTRDFDSVRSTLKRDHEKEDNFTHKVSLARSSRVLRRFSKAAQDVISSLFCERSASPTDSHSGTQLPPSSLRSFISLRVPIRAP